MLGVGLTPLGWATLIGEDASHYANAFVELGDRLGTPGDILADRLAACPDDLARCALLDALFAERANGVEIDATLAVRAQEILAAGETETVVAFVSAMGLRYRTFNRLCLRAFGFGPKRLFRRQRFLRTLGQVRDKLDQPLGAILDAGYYDQAHFNHEFRTHMGMTPTAYFNSPREVMRRAAAERLRVVGASVQGLHGTGG